MKGTQLRINAKVHQWKISLSGIAFINSYCDHFHLIIIVFSVQHVQNPNRIWFDLRITLIPAFNG